MRWAAYLFAAMVLLTSAASAQTRPRRVALIIGNASYALAPLPNAAHDIDLIAGAAARAQFDVVRALDQTKADFRTTLTSFATLAEGAQVAMIYFAGHGVETDQGNWLLPVDAMPTNEDELTSQSVSLQAVIDATEGAAVRLVVMDACRDNQFGKSERFRGMAPVYTSSGNVLLIFSSESGARASDGMGQNSPFAIAFSNRLPQPSLALQRLGEHLRDDVFAATRHRFPPQQPMSVSRLPASAFFLVPGPHDFSTEPSTTSAIGLPDLSTQLISPGVVTVRVGGGPPGLALEDLRRGSFEAVQAAVAGLGFQDAALMWRDDQTLLVILGGPGANRSPQAYPTRRCPSTVGLRELRNNLTIAGLCVADRLNALRQFIDVELALAPQTTDP